MNLNQSFLKHCEDNKFEINQNQLDIIDNLKDYYNDNFHQSLLSKIFIDASLSFVIFLKNLLSIKLLD